MHFLENYFAEKVYTPPFKCYVFLVDKKSSNPSFYAPFCLSRRLLCPHVDNSVGGGGSVLGGQGYIGVCFEGQLKKEPGGKRKKKLSETLHELFTRCSKKIHSLCSFPISNLLRFQPFVYYKVLKCIDCPI